MKRYGIAILIEEDYDAERGIRKRYFRRIVKRFDKRKNLLRLVKKVMKATRKTRR